MKTTIKTLTVILAFLFSITACQKSPAPLTDAEKEEIKKEVKAAFDLSAASLNTHNPEEIYKNLWNSEEFLFAGYGEIMKGWENNFKSAAEIHENPKYQIFTVDFDEVIIRVINREAALATGSGYFNNFPGENGPKSVKMAVSLLFEKIDGKWLTTVIHESANEIIF